MKPQNEEKRVHARMSYTLPVRHVFNKVMKDESMKKYYIRLNGYHARK